LALSLSRGGGRGLPSLDASAKPCLALALWIQPGCNDFTPEIGGDMPPTTAWISPQRRGKLILRWIVVEHPIWIYSALDYSLRCTLFPARNSVPQNLNKLVARSCGDGTINTASNWKRHFPHPHHRQDNTIPLTGLSSAEDRAAHSLFGPTSQPASQPASLPTSNDC
jgi:hypothetical protein